MPEPEVAGIYCRLSHARHSDRTKVEDQERICRELAAQRGWQVLRAYADNSRSAWQLNRKRPGWDAMLADVEAGRITAIVVYHGDRLIRQPRDLEDLIDLARSRGISLAAPTGTRDLGDADDQFILRIEAAQACKSSDDLSRRKRAGFERMRRAGMAPPAGSRWRRGFGYESDGRTPVPGEAAALREAVRLLIAGEGIVPVAERLAARGVTSPSGKPISYKLLRSVLLRPRTAGLFPDGTPGAWEPLISASEQAMLAQMLTARTAGRPAATNEPRHLLSGIARCGKCGAGMQRHNTGRAGAGVTVYACRAPGCRRVARNMTQLEEYVIARTLARLGHEANPPGRLPGTPGAAAELAALARQKAEAEAAVRDPRNSGRLDLLLARLDGVEARMTAVAELARAVGARAELIAAHAGLDRAGWDAEPLAVRRALAAACFTVEVLPASHRGRGFWTEDVRLTPLR